MANNKFKSKKDETRAYDLMERTSKFGESIIDFVKSINSNPHNKSLITQIIRSATSIGANYMEADCAESKKDFRHKISICRKEAKETQYWLRMLARTNPDKINICRKYWLEANELVKIFSSIIINSKENEVE